MNFLKKDWTDFQSINYEIKNELECVYNNFKKIFFLKVIPNKNYVYLEREEIQILKKIFYKYSYISLKFRQIHEGLSRSWPCWVILDRDNFEWILTLEPIDEFSVFKDLFAHNHFILLSAQRKDNFLTQYFRNSNIRINFNIHFKSDFVEKNILIYVPKRQMLPNNPSFAKAIISKCQKFIILTKGFTVILSNEDNLKTKIATSLAASYGQRVLLESFSNKNDQILCSSYDWWIKNSSFFVVPDQIIVPLLPIPSMGEPITNLTVSLNTKNSKDWFRESFIPETFDILDHAISPLRRNAGKMIVLDGRVNNRTWGREIVERIEPSKFINYIFPFE